jgi:uncharacterized membrane protein
MVQQIAAIAAILLGLYLLAESIAAAALMHGGDRLCRVAKYLVTGIVGIWLIVEHDHADAWHIAMAVALALFLWPKMLKRIETLIDEFMEDGHA